MYEGDRTIIQLGRMRECIEVTGGIRQGCCISTLLFKMVTFTTRSTQREQTFVTAANYPNIACYCRERSE